MHTTCYVAMHIECCKENKVQRMATDRDGIDRDGTGTIGNFLSSMNSAAISFNILAHLCFCNFEITNYY